jgi:hypothetical protein
MAGSTFLLSPTSSVTHRSPPPPVRPRLLRPPAVALGLLLSTAAVLDAQGLRPIVAIDARGAQVVEPPDTRGGAVPTMATQPGVLQLVRSQQSLGRTATITLQLSGTATAGVDYVAPPVTVTFAANESVLNIPIAPLADGVSERDETIIVSIVPKSAYDIASGRDQVTLSMIDANPRVRLSVSDPTLAEGGEDGEVRIERLGTLRGDLWVPLGYAGQASPVRDLVGLPDSVRIPAGAAEVRLPLVAAADDDAEGSESFQVRVVRLPVELTAPANFSIGDHAVAFTAPPGSVTEQAGTVTFTLQRSGSTRRAIEVPVVLSGSASAGSDYTVVGLTATPPRTVLVRFAEGQRTVTLPVQLIADTLVEGGESITATVRTVPSLAAGLPNSATIVIDDVAPPRVATVVLSPTLVTGGRPVTVTVTLNGPAPAGGVPITLAADNPVVTTPTGVEIAAGERAVVVRLTTQPVPVNRVITVSAGAPTGPTVSQQVTLLAPFITGLSLSASSVVAQALVDSLSLSGSLTLGGPAPAGGLTIQLSVTGTTAVTPPTVVVPPGATSTTFRVAVSPVSTPASATLQASGQSATVRVEPPAIARVVLRPSEVTGTARPAPAPAPSGAFAMEVELTGASPGGEATVTAGSPLIEPPRASVPLGAGARNATLPMRGRTVAVVTPVPITVSWLGATTTTTLQLLPPAPTSIAVTPTSLRGGETLTATVQLNTPAPAEGLGVPVTFSNTSARLCAGGTTVTVPGDAATHRFDVCTSVVTRSTPVVLGVGTAPSLQTAAFTLEPPPQVASLVSALTRMTGKVEQPALTVTLTEPAPVGGLRIRLETSSRALKFSNPSSVDSPTELVVPAGARTAAIRLQADAVPRDETVTITATPGGASTVVTVLAPQMRSIVLPQVLDGGATASGTVVLTGPPPPAGMVVTLTSDVPGVTVPPVVTVLGSASSDFSISTSPVATDVRATITARTAGAEVRASLTVSAGVRLLNIAGGESFVRPGEQRLLRATLDRPAGGAGAFVTLATDNPSLSLPTTLSILPGSQFGEVTMSAPPRTAPSTEQAVVTATLGGRSASQRFQLPGVDPELITFDQPTVVGGAPLVGRVTLFAPAPPGGIDVQLTGGPTIVPATIRVEPGQRTQAFTLQTRAVSISTIDELRATSVGGLVRATASLTIEPVAILSFGLAPGEPGQVAGGGEVRLRLTLRGPAPLGGARVELSSSHPELVSLPRELLVPEGATFGEVTARSTPTATLTTVVLSVARSVNVLRQSLTVLPPLPQSIVIDPAEAIGGTVRTVTVTLNAPAPGPMVFNPIVFPATSAVQPPPLISVPTGATTFTFAIQTSAVTVRYDGRIALQPLALLSAPLTLLPP